ncbi:MAG: 6-hydroxymethylpterin diphosphokinase MptE-like protein [Thermoplasmatota archaeon]
MEFVRWKPFYEEILRTFEFDPQADLASRDVLAGLLRTRSPPPATVFDALRQAAQGRAVAIVGAGFSVTPARVEGALLHPAGSSSHPGQSHEGHGGHGSAGAKLARPLSVFVADKAVAPYMAQGGRATAIVSDLDGDLHAIAQANADGIPVCVHAHGDNIDAVREWVPRFRGPLIGTTQAEPVPPLYNMGGFTDGDRACFLAEALGATELVLAGFDFEHAASERKQRKLAFAHRLLRELDIPWVVMDRPGAP